MIASLIYLNLISDVMTMPNDEPTRDPTTSSEVTRLLAAIQGGRREATDQLLPLVYRELRQMANRQMGREAPGQTLQPTALVNEAYMRLIDDRYLPWQNRAHFFTAAAEAMRRILIDRARRAARVKHGGDRMRVTLGHQTPGEQPSPEELLTLDQAIDKLDKLDPSMCEVVKLRYFAGLTVPETASCLDVSPRTVNRLWTGARAWLQREVENAGR